MRLYNGFMKIFMACPAPPRSRKGNRVTAMRWARILKELGHRVTIGQDLDGGRYDLLVALHARRSHEAVVTFRRHCPRGPILVALTGTDLYRDLARSRQAQQSLVMADRLVVLQPHALTVLPATSRDKVRVIRQSTLPVGRRSRPSAYFDVCVLGHLRQEKDPFRAALSLRLLPGASRLRLTHAGAALSAVLEKQARRLMAGNGRYRWLGEVPRWRARRLLADSRLLVISSRMEGGANVVSEALVEGVPVLASQVSGNIGMLGEDYPGYYPVGDTRALARLLWRAESDAQFYRLLEKRCRRLAPLFTPVRERGAWENLLEELATRNPKPCL